MRNQRVVSTQYHAVPDTVIEWLGKLVGNTDGDETITDIVWFQIIHVEQEVWSVVAVVNTEIPDSYPGRIAGYQAGYEVVPIQGVEEERC